VAVKSIVDVYVNGDRVAFALPEIPLDRVPVGWRFSRAVQYEVSPGPQASELNKILAGLTGRDFYIPSEEQQFVAKEALGS
jgi:hypothetical protein